MIDQIIGQRYRVLEELGRGGMGTVFLAHDPVLEREVAIKLLTSTFRTSTSSREVRFHREARIVARMDHPAIVGIFDIGEHDGAPFLVMPFVPGYHLRNAFKHEGLTLDDVLEIGIQVAEALDHSHRLGVVHRDIKPENIIVERQEEGLLRVRVTDFGLATVTTSDRLTKSGSVIGTASYLSPEQSQGHEVDGRSDIYSLAVVLYEALTGQVPFSGLPHAVLYRIVHEVPKAPSSLVADVDSELEAILMRNLAKTPAERYQRALDLARALADYRESIDQSERLHPLAHSPRSQTRPRRAPNLVPLVARQEEMVELTTRLDAAIAEGCQFVVIGGETGVGKSRLLEELEVIATNRHVRTLHGRLVEQDLHFPYQGFCEAIQEYFVTRSHSEEVTADFTDLAPELASLFPVLSEIDVIRSSTTELNLRPPEQPRTEDPTYIFEVLARAFSRIATEEPLVLLLEGLHAAEASLEALQYLVRRLGHAPVLVVGTYRSTQVSPDHALVDLLDSFDGDRRFSSLLLEPLARAEIGQLLLRASTGIPLDEALVDQLFDSTEGNPYFTLELFRALLDAGSVAQDAAGTYVLTEDDSVGPPSLPATIQQAVEKRIEGIPELLRMVLAAASVLGRTFQYRDLEIVTQDIDDLEEAVDTLVERGFLEEKREIRGDALRFSSVVVRDVLYTSLSRRRRRRLHRRFAEHLEQRYTGQLERVYDPLVHHFAQADVPDRVVLYGLDLARQELDLASSEEAARTCRLVLEFLDDQEVGSRLVEGRTRRMLASALRMRGDLDNAITELGRAIRCFEDAKDTAALSRTVVLAAETAWEARRVDEARQYVESGLTGDDDLIESEDRSRLLSLGITLANLRGDYELAQHYGKEKLESSPLRYGKTVALPSGGLITVGIPAEVRARHPATLTTNEEEEVLTNVFEPLLLADREGALVPHLCQRWQVAEDGRTFRLELRPGVLFHDGSPLRAEEVRSSLECAARMGGRSLTGGLTVIDGIDEFLEGKEESLRGVRALDELTLEIELSEPLPSYPVLLTDPWLAISKASADSVGTGPFRLLETRRNKVLLERFGDYWGPLPPLLDRLEFRTGLSARELSSGLRSGSIDVARDLSPEQLDEVLRLRHQRWRLVEETRKSSCFALFNQRSNSGLSDSLRRALFGVVRTRDLVRSTLGRLAVPAEGLIPPGILGHDPGRRRRPLAWETAERLIEVARRSGQALRLRIVVHPILQERYGSLTRALIQVWSDLGLDIVLEIGPLESYLELSHEDLGEVDLVLARWSADYADPDNFTRSLFQSEVGRFRHQYSSPELDGVLEEARRESRLSHRRRMYREIESSFLDEHRVLPLFHEIDQRIAHPEVLGLRLGPSPPWVNYAGIARGAQQSKPSRKNRGGTIRIAFPERIPDLDPHYFGRARWQVTPLIFEGLTHQGRDARIVPWLARSIEREDGGRRYRFELHEDARFHDGRRVDARDVRYSFERMARDKRSNACWILASIRGARSLLAGMSEGLEGFTIVSSREFTLDLEQPLSFLPALLTAVPIVPEEAETFDTTWRGGCIGTGPFRVRRFEPGERLDLEPNPDYRIPDLPRCESLQISLGVPDTAILDGFKDGTYSLASSLSSAQVHELSEHPTLASCYREVPGLSTCFLAMNAHFGALADPDLRKKLSQAIALDRLVVQSLGRHGRPAQGLIPPDLLPSSSGSRSSVSDEYATTKERARLRLLRHSVFESTYRDVEDYLVRCLDAVGFEIEILPERHDDPVDLDFSQVDLVLSWWSADYPDPDSFVHGLLHSKEGDIGMFCGTPEIDRLIHLGREQTDPRDRQDIYREIEDLLSRGALLLPLFHEQSYRFVRPEVQGFELLLREPAVAYERLWIKS